VLLVRHVEGNDWTTPGGMIEPLETPADAAVRETWEETGLHVELESLLMKQHVPPVLAIAFSAAPHAHFEPSTWTP
jgi:8-oxo-dGTP pyrophosphatase MutT (NUDIX family)